MVQGIEELGFLPGWGNTVGRVRESFQLLLDIVQASSFRGMLACWWWGHTTAGADSEGLLNPGLLGCPNRCPAARSYTPLLGCWAKSLLFRLPACPALQAPDADTLEKFLGRLPLMFKARRCSSAAPYVHVHA